MLSLIDNLAPAALQRVSRVVGSRLPEPDQLTNMAWEAAGSMASNAGQSVIADPSVLMASPFNKKSENEDLVQPEKTTRLRYLA